jgi:hypothetical protein
MGWSYNIHGRGNNCIKIYLESPKGRNHLGDLSIGERIIIK